MLTITEAARVQLVLITEKNGLPDDVAIRLVRDGQGLAMGPDSERPGDTKFEHEGRTVLLLDGEMSAELAEETLDADGAKLTFQRSQSDA